MSGSPFLTIAPSIASSTSRFRCSETLSSKDTMSLTTIARRNLLLRSSFTRHNSTFSPSSPPSASSSSTPTPETKTSPTQLPPEKMRALISLYHQSKDFISPLNLSNKIDEVFAKDFYANSSMFTGYSELKSRMAERKAAPVIGNAQNKEQLMDSTWSTGPAERREEMVFDALYGVNDGMPGLETLLDEEGRVREAVKEDKAVGSSS